MKFVFRTCGGIKSWDPVEASDTGGPSSITVRMECLLTFQYWYCELCVENRWGGDKKQFFIFLFFVGAWIFNRWGGGGGRKSYLGPAEIASFSSRSFHISIKFRLNLKHRSFLIFYYVWKQAVVRMFFKIGVRKNFASLTGKHLCWSLFLITLQALWLSGFQLY